MTAAVSHLRVLPLPALPEISAPVTALPPAPEVLHELLLRSGRGDQVAFSRLFDVVLPVMLASARLLAPSAQAEAVAEEAYVDVWRLSPGYVRSGSSPLAWITARVERAASRLRV
jgi:RNA polymerase sigma-70 factor, ECF subfamily